MNLNFSDIDSDGDFDIIASLGGGNYHDIYMIENIGNASQAYYLHICNFH